MSIAKATCLRKHTSGVASLRIKRNPLKFFRGTGGNFDHGKDKKVLASNHKF